MNARILIIGGGRFVGWHLLKMLHAHGIAVDVLNRGHTRPAHTLPDGVNHLCADRSQAEAVQAVLKGRTYSTVFDTSGYRPLEVNNVLEAINTEHYVYMSTLVVYAALQHGWTDNGNSISEDSPTIDTSEADTDYAGNKRACEQVLLNQNRVRATILRPCGIYGVGDYWYRHDYFFDRIASNRPVLIPESHVGRRIHLTSVTGLTEACRLAAEARHDGHRVFNVADQEPTTCDALARLCSEAAGAPSRIMTYREEQVTGQTFGPLAVFPFGNEPPFNLDSASITEQLGWQPSSLTVGTAELWKDYRRRVRLSQTVPPDYTLDDYVIESGALSASTVTGHGLEL